jgi:hypothetical protein
MSWSGGRFLGLVLLLLWSGAIWWGLTTTRVSDTAWFPGSGLVFNLGHAVLFGVEALLLGWVLHPEERPGHGRWLLASTLAWLYSAGLEGRQGFLDGREASLADLLTNAIGAFGVPWMLADRTTRARRAVWVGLGALGSALLDTLT